MVIGTEMSPSIFCRRCTADPAGAYEGVRKGIRIATSKVSWRDVLVYADVHQCMLNVRWCSAMNRLYR